MLMGSKRKGRAARSVDVFSQGIPPRVFWDMKRARQRADNIRSTHLVDLSCLLHVRYCSSQQSGGDDEPHQQPAEHLCHRATVAGRRSPLLARLVRRVAASVGAWSITNLGCPVGCIPAQRESRPPAAGAQGAFRSAAVSAR